MRRHQLLDAIQRASDSGERQAFASPVLPPSRAGHSHRGCTLEAQRVRGDHNDELTLTFIAPTSLQQFPDACAGCIDTSGVSISIRNVFGADGIRFRIDDPAGVLPWPFPVFGGWTRFGEDEYLDERRRPRRAGGTGLVPSGRTSRRSR